MQGVFKTNLEFIYEHARTSGGFPDASCNYQLMGFYNHMHWSLSRKYIKMGIRGWFSLQIPIFCPLSPFPDFFRKGDTGGMGEYLRQGCAQLSIGVSPNYCTHRGTFRSLSVEVPFYVFIRFNSFSRSDFGDCGQTFFVCRSIASILCERYRRTNHTLFYHLLFTIHNQSGFSAPGWYPRCHLLQRKIN